MAFTPLKIPFHLEKLLWQNWSLRQKLNILHWSTITVTI